MSAGGFDPQGHHGDGLNLYGYLGANPLNRRDALGLDWLDDQFAFDAGYVSGGAANASEATSLAGCPGAATSTCRCAATMGSVTCFEEERSALNIYSPQKS